METRLMAGAFLKYEGKVLLMKRGLHRKLNPGKWAPIGGHLEPNEINFPSKACLREIEEETGIRASDISDFALRFILVRNTGLEIRVNYIFTGNLTKEHALRNCDEGSLHWVDYGALADYDISFSVKQAAISLVQNPGERRVLLGAVSAGNDHIVWSAL